MTLWILFGVMLVAGALFVTWPMFRQDQKLTLGLGIAAAAVLSISAGFYILLGSPATPSGADAMPSVEDMVASLEQRLKENPEDLSGWKMLGRSAMQMREFGRAVNAFEQASRIEGGNNGQTLADLGEAVLLEQGDRVAGRAAELFEASLAVTPNNPKALFYGGIAAIERGDRSGAADRWEALLALSPPPEVQEILRQRITEWRAEPGAAPVTAAADIAVSVEVSVSESANAALDGNESVFVIARDPRQPSPPIAVARRKASELPVVVTLTDANAMIPGRLLSQFQNIEIVVRASASGNPIAETGDWFGSQQLDLSTTSTVGIVIDQQTP